MTMMMGADGRCGRKTCHSDAVCIRTTSRSHRCRCRDGFYGNGKICIGIVACSYMSLDRQRLFVLLGNIAVGYLTTLSYNRGLREKVHFVSKKKLNANEINIRLKQ